MDGTEAGDGDTGSLRGEQIPAMAKTAPIVIECGPSCRPAEQTQEETCPNQGGLGLRGQ